MRSRWLLVGVVAVAGLWAAPAIAGECTTAVVQGTPALGRVDAGVRLRFVRERLRHEARRARIWSWTWAGIYTGLTAGQLALTAAVARDQRRDYYVGAGAAFIGLIPLTVMPLSVMGDQKWLERRLATAPPGTHECVLLAEAETLLVRDAKNEAFGRSSLVHIGNVVVNLIVFTIIGAGFGHWPNASISFVTGVVVGEAMIYTQPLGAVDDLDRYRGGDLGLAAPAARPFTLRLAPFVAAGEPRGWARGASVALRF
jgi:hypothetical protein